MNPDLTFPAREDESLALQPLNDATRELVRRTNTHVAALLDQADKLQAEFNRIHKSKFNPHNLYTEFTYSRRCDEGGSPDPNGACYRGIELQMTSSVEELIDCVTVDYAANEGELQVYFGRPGGNGPSGLVVDTHTEFNRNRLEKPIQSELRMKKFEVRLEPQGDNDTVLYASKTAPNPLEAMKTANALPSAYLSKCGLEAKVYNLVRQRTNVVEVGDENMADYIRMDGEPRASYPNAVIVTATRVCRRCQSEFPWLFVGMTKERTDLKFGIAFTDKPKLTFIPKVLVEDCGDVRTSGLVTPFVILYKDGLFQEYLATKKEDDPPHEPAVRALIGKHFGDG
jgi:hypothetical protein